MLKHCLILLSATGVFAADVTTFHNDNTRTGQNLNETILTPSNINSTNFGKLFTISVDGKVDAQPLYLTSVTFPVQGTHNALYVATEHGTVYAFDADTGTMLWSKTTLVSGETTSDTRGCGQVSPEIGITSTPVISRTIGPNGTIYVVGMSKTSAGVYHQRLHALDITTGAEQFGGPVEVQATYPGTGDNSSNGHVVFDPAQYKERAALLLINGVLYTSCASHCDIRPYTGWLMSYDANTVAQINVFNFGCTATYLPGSTRWQMLAAKAFCLRVTPTQHPFGPQNIVRGSNRPDRWTNIWISDPANSLPAWVELRLPRTSLLDLAQITFDTDVNRLSRKPLFRYPDCVKSYDVSVWRSGMWRKVGGEDGNYMRRRELRFDPIRSDRVRIDIAATNGAQSARVYEVRLYGPAGAS